MGVRARGGLGLLFGGVWLGAGERSMWVPHVCQFFLLQI